MLVLLACVARVPAVPATPRMDQDTTFISGTSSCSRCSIDLRRLVALSFPDTLVVNPLILSVASLSTGEFVATGIGTPGTVAFFRRDGRFDHQIGRVGKGPGEFQLARRVGVGRKDSVFILDAALRRLSILSGRGVFVRSLPTYQVNALDFAELTNGDFLLAGPAFSKEGAGFSIHSLARNGDGVRPLGESVRNFGPETQSDLMRAIVPNHDSTVWIARVNRYVIEHRALAGRLLQVLERRADWFLPWQLNPPPVDKPSKPAVIRIAIDSEGRLWVFLVVTSANFKALSYGPPVPGARTDARQLPPIEEIYKNFDTRIEILDPIRGSVLASVQVPGVLYPATPFPLALRLDYGRDGTETVVVYRLNLDSAGRGSVKP